MSRSDTFQLPPNTVQCSQVGDGPWTCKPPSEAEPPDSPEAKIREELARGDVTVRDETIGGASVRCFSFPTGGDLNETCLMKQGVVARMVTESSRLELIAFGPAVSDDVFTLPAVAE